MQQCLQHLAVHSEALEEGERADHDPPDNRAEEKEQHEEQKPERVGHRPGVVSVHPNFNPLRHPQIEQRRHQREEK